MMFAAEVCKLPATGSSTSLIVVAIIFVVCGVAAIRWVRVNTNRLATFVAPLVLVGGLTLLPQASTCFDPSIDAPVLTEIEALPLAVTPLLAFGSVNAGDPISVTFSGFASNEIVQLVVASNPQVIGWVTSNALGGGILTGTIPANLTLGEHTLVVYSPSRGTGFKQVITVGGSSTPTESSTTSTTVVSTESTTTSTTVASIPSTTTTTSTTLIGAACAAGGTCAIGDTGPGGGIVFFVDLGAAAGSRYLEAACVGWSNNCDGVTADPVAAWGCMGQVVTGAAGTNIGTGLQNSSSIMTDCGVIGVAADLALNSESGGKSDWFLPSKFEINELCKYARDTGQPAGSDTQCAGGILRSGFQVNRYWTSSEYDVTRAWFKNFENGNYNVNDKTYALYSVRPIRAF